MSWDHSPSENILLPKVSSVCGPFKTLADRPFSPPSIRESIRPSPNPNEPVNWLNKSSSTCRRYTPLVQPTGTRKLKGLNGSAYPASCEYFGYNASCAIRDLLHEAVANVNSSIMMSLILMSSLLMTSARPRLSLKCRPVCVQRELLPQQINELFFCQQRNISSTFKERLDIPDDLSPL
jgi:hypothetical protein